MCGVCVLCMVGMTRHSCRGRTPTWCCARMATFLCAKTYARVASTSCQACSRSCTPFSPPSYADVVDVAGLAQALAARRSVGTRAHQGTCMRILHARITEYCRTWRSTACHISSTTTSVHASPSSRAAGCTAICMHASTPLTNQPQPMHAWRSGSTWWRTAHV